MPKEFAPGIPKERKALPFPELSDENRRMVIQSHPAAKAGDHFDLRIGGKESGNAFSWATKKPLPKPGDAPISVFEQPTHTYDYMSFNGPISNGYGATRPGESVQAASDSDIHILRSNRDEIRFNSYAKKVPQEFLMKRTDKNRWIMMNVTKTQKKMSQFGVSFDKPKIKEIKTSEIDFMNQDELMMAKIDGANNLFILRKGSHPIFMSYRLPKNDKIGVLDHTPQMKGAYQTKTPAEFGDTILRGEIYAKDSSGRALAPELIAGMLNSSVPKSLEAQKKHGNLVPSMFDVIKYKGKDVSNLPYSDKLRIMKEIRAKMPMFEIPEHALDPEEKRKLWNSISSKNNLSTREGAILRSLTTPSGLKKAKIKSDHDVYVRDITRLKDKDGNFRDEAGAILYSTEPDGPIVGRVGTGFSKRARKDMWKNKEKYIGAVARVSALNQYKSGALAKPAFQGWHVDKSSPSFWNAEPVAK